MLPTESSASRISTMTLATLSILFELPTASAVTVAESTLSKNAVVVTMTASEVKEAKTRTGSIKLGATVAKEMILLAGVPESMTGKFAAVSVWAILCAKYEGDIRDYASKTPDGNNLTLKYSGVDLDGVRRVWAATEAADHAIPGGELIKMILDTINKLANAFLG